MYTDENSLFLLLNSALTTKTGTITNISTKISQNNSWVKKCGNIVSLQINAGLKTTLASGDILFTLPQDFKPNSDRDIQFFLTINAKNVLIDIGKDTGNVIIRGDFSASTWITGLITYIAL